MSGMDKTELNEMYKNRREMKRLARFSNVAFWIGLLPGIAFTAISAIFLVLSMLNPNSSALALGINLLLCIVYSWLFFSGIGERNAIKTVAAPIIYLAAGALCAALGGQTELSIGEMEMFYFLPAFMIALISLYTYHRYDYLEQQPGYPYFDEGLKANEEASRESRFHSEYKDNYEEWKKNERSEMDSATACGLIREHKRTENTDFMGVSDVSQAGSDLTHKSDEKPRDYFAEMREKEMQEKLRLAKLNKMTEHADMMRKNEKLRRLPLPVYVILCVPCILAVPFLFPLYKTGEVAYALIDALLFKTSALICGAIGVKKRHNILCIAAPVILLLNTLIVRSPSVLWLFSLTKLPFNLLWALISAAVCVLNISANQRYRFLEQQFGFPYFNKRMLEDEPVAVRRVKTNEHPAASEARKPAVNDMGIPIRPEPAKNEPATANGFMDEI